jgi:twitching motility protein PilT
MSISEIVESLLKQKLNFSDILIKDGDHLRYRLPSGYVVCADVPILRTEDIHSFLTLIHTDGLDYSTNMVRNGGHLDFAITFYGVRFRCNLFLFGGLARWGMSLRKLNNSIPVLSTLGLPLSVQSLAERSSGLILCTGATGSGKSTTLAALVDHVNSTREAHIVTIEDPIEYLQLNKKSSVTQREIGADVSSFANGLKASLREDPDVILIGEIRDKETCMAAIAAAETGHLVLSTLHTTSAAKSVERLIDFFDGSEKKQQQSVIASVLAGIVSQVLVPSLDRSSRILVAEVMINVPSITAAIRNDKLQQLSNEMLNTSKDGQSLLNKELVKRVFSRNISRSDARLASYDPIEFDVEFKNAQDSQ